METNRKRKIAVETPCTEEHATEADAREHSESTSQLCFQRMRKALQSNSDPSAVDDLSTLEAAMRYRDTTRGRATSGGMKYQPLFMLDMVKLSDMLKNADVRPVINMSMSVALQLELGEHLTSQGNFVMPAANTVRRQMVNFDMATMMFSRSRV